MYVFIRNRNKGEIGWQNITNYVTDEIGIDDVIDGTKDTGSINLLLNEDFTYLPYDKSIPPKLEVKISQYNNIALENEINTYWFLTGDNDAKLIRRGNADVKELYQHVVNLREYSEIASDTNLPNYTITQPKTQYFDMYSRYGFREYTLNQKYQQDGLSKNFLYSTQYDGNLIPSNTTQINFGYDVLTNSYYVDLDELDTVGYNVQFDLTYRKTAYTRYNANFILNGSIFPLHNNAERRMFSQTRIKAVIKYYIGSMLFREEEKIFKKEYIGGLVEVENNLVSITKIKSLPFDYQTTRIELSIKKQLIANRAVVHFELLVDEEDEETNGVETFDNAYSVNTEISGFNNNAFVKVDISTLRLSVTSGQLQNEITVPKYTLLQFVEKSLFDYNLNRRLKLSLDDETSVLLDVEAKEGEWEAYNLMELLERAFKYIGCSYYITINNVITHIKPTLASIIIDLKDGQSLDETISYENHIDTMVSKAKNVMSQNDFVTERILIGSIDNNFSQFTEETAGFLTSGNQYFVSNAKLYAPSFSIVLDGNTINTNMGVPFMWDVTSRFLEQDIYKSLPDVRYDTSRDAVNQLPSQRATRDLGQGNTIYYTSGSNVVGGACHMPPTIPDYNFETGAVIGNVAQYAMVEMLVCLAYETINTKPAWEIPNPTVDVEFPAIANWELEITYCPIFEELTTKYISNMKNRQGLNWEKKVNVSDRVISYEDNEQVLKNEMESQGNNEYSYDVVVASLEDTFRVGDIINGNMYITSKKMVITNGVINVTYRMQENFIIQNQDVGLSTKFERYAVPYEYVFREMILENHIVVSQTKIPEYTVNNYYILQLLRDVYVSGDINGALYATLNVQYEDSSQRNILMRIAKMESKFTMILTGKFVDNYGAGVQRFAGTLDAQSAIFSQPYRYCDYQGKAKKVFITNLGYNSTVGSVRLGVDNGTSVVNYPLNYFPQANWENNDVVYDKNYIVASSPIEILNDKDAREGLMLNIHNFLETESEDTKFYGFKPINKIGILNADLSLVDDLDMDSVSQYITNIIDVTPIVGDDLGHNYISIGMARATYNGKNIVLMNETNNTYTLVGILNNAFVDASNTLYIYMYGLKYGRTA